MKNHMKRYSALQYFMSPITGRILCLDNDVLTGNTQNIAIPGPGGGGGGGAPFDATYIVQTPDSSLPEAQDLQTLANGSINDTGGILWTRGPLDPPTAPTPVGELRLARGGAPTTVAEVGLYDYINSLGYYTDILTVKTHITVIEVTLAALTATVTALGIDLDLRIAALEDINSGYSSIICQYNGHTDCPVTSTPSQLIFSLNPPVGFPNNPNFTLITPTSIQFTGPYPIDAISTFTSTLNPGLGGNMNLVLYINGIPIPPPSPPIYNVTAPSAGINYLVSLCNGISLNPGDILTIWGWSLNPTDTWSINQPCWSVVSTKVYT